MKKLLAMALSAVMLLSCAAVPVHAQENTDATGVTYTAPARKGAQGSVASQATRLSVNGLWEGTYDAGVTKYFKFTTTSNSSYYTLHLNVRGDHDLRFKVYSDEYVTKLVKEGSCSERSTNDIDLRKLEKNHTYYVEIYNGYGYSSVSSIPFAVGIMERKDAVGDDGFSATAIALNKEVRSKLECGKDYDYFSFKTTKADTFYDVVIGNFGTDSEVHIDVYKDKFSSNSVKENFYVDKKSRGSVSLGKLDKNTTYYVCVRAEYYSADIIDNSYSIRIKSKKDDVTDYLSKAKQLKIAKTEKKAIQDFSDVDYYKFKTLNKKLDYTIKVKNTGTTELYAYVYKDKEETQKIGQAYANQGEALTINLDSLGKNKTYYVRIAPRQWSKVYGNYSISVTPKAKPLKSSAGTGMKKGIKVTMKAGGTVSGYQVRYRVTSSGKRFATKTFKTSKSKITKKITGLKKRTYYQVQVRSYYTYNKKKYYSDWESISDSWFGYDVSTK